MKLKDGLGMRYLGDAGLKENILDNKIDVTNELELKTAAEAAYLMMEIMDSLGGVGLAANQIGLTIPIFVFSYKDSNGVAINPEIIKISDELIEDVKEGCLSVPGVDLPATRAQTLTLKAYSIGGAEFELDASGYLARVVQHEMDHLSGKTIADGLSREARRKLQRAYR